MFCGFDFCVLENVVFVGVGIGFLLCFLGEVCDDVVEVMEFILEWYGFMWFVIYVDFYCMVKV